MPRRFLNHALVLGFLASANLLPASAVSAAPVAELFANTCARCHGEDGRGHTKMGRKLRIVDFTSASVQARLTPSRILDSITHGKPDANGNERMPAFGEKLTEEERRALAAYVKTFGDASKARK